MMGNVMLPGLKLGKTFQQRLEYRAMGTFETLYRKRNKKNQPIECGETARRDSKS
jgi:hypothetical protein